MKKLEIKKTKPTLIISTFKTAIIKVGLFFSISNFFIAKSLWQIIGGVLAAVILLYLLNDKTLCVIILHYEASSVTNYVHPEFFLCLNTMFILQEKDKKKKFV